MAGWGHGAQLVEPEWWSRLQGMQGGGGEAEKKRNRSLEFGVGWGRGGQGYITCCEYHPMEELTEGATQVQVPSNQNRQVRGDQHALAIFMHCMRRHTRWRRLHACQRGVAIIHRHGNPSSSQL